MTYLYELSRRTEFTVQHEHLTLLRNSYIGYNNYTEFGAPRVDPKRPYGNSDVYLDIAEILGIEADGTDEYGDPVFSETQQESMHRTHFEMMLVLQILTANLSITPGRYRKTTIDPISWRPA